jgi:NitT/TauT family transport system substrate-binding protein
MKGQLVSLGFAISATLALAGIAAPARSAEPLTIGYGSPWIGQGPLHIAAQKGYFEDEGLDVNLTKFEWNSPQEAFDALAAKQIDVLPPSLDEGTLYWRPETPFAVILATDASSGGDGVLIRTDRNIGSIKDFKAKRVALRLNTPSHFFLSYLLRQNGMSEDDVTLVDISPEEAAKAVVAGDVDVAVTWNPYLVKAAEDPKVDFLVTSKDTPGLIADVLVMRKDLLDSNPEACQGLVRAWNKAVEYQNANPDEAAAIMAKGLGYGTPDDIKADLAGIVLQGKEENAQLFAGDGEGTALGTARFAIDLWTELGRLTTPVKAEDLIDASCLEQ